MQTTVETSELMQQRVNKVTQHTDDIIKAIRERDFPTFAAITMKVRLRIIAVLLSKLVSFSYTYTRQERRIVVTTFPRLLSESLFDVLETLETIELELELGQGPNT